MVARNILFSGGPADGQTASTDWDIAFMQDYDDDDEPFGWAKYKTSNGEFIDGAEVFYCIQRWMTE